MHAYDFLDGSCLEKPVKPEGKFAFAHAEGPSFETELGHIHLVCEWASLEYATTPALFESWLFAMEKCMWTLHPPGKKVENFPSFIHISRANPIPTRLQSFLSCLYLNDTFIFIFLL